MGKAETIDPKKAEKKARKRAKKEAKKEDKKRIKKEKKRLEKEARKLQAKKAKGDAEDDGSVASSSAASSAAASPPPRETQKKASASSQKKRKLADPSSQQQNPPKEDVKNSVYHKKRIEVAVSVLPAAMGNIRAALEDAVRLMLLKYTDQVGILLTFENIQVIGNGGHGMVLDEIPYLHYKIAFDGLVFSPQVGSQLSGKVTESFPSHLGLLILNYVNAMIPAEKLHDAGYVFDSDMNEWVHQEDETVVGKDANVDFVVAKIHEVAGTISMEGSKPTIVV